MLTGIRNNDILFIPSHTGGLDHVTFHQYHREVDAGFYPH